MAKKIYLIISMSAALFIIPSYAQNTFPQVGKVGVGTTSPAEELEVIGDVRIDGLKHVSSQPNAAIGLRYVMVDEAGKLIPGEVKPAPSPGGMGGGAPWIPGPPSCSQTYNQLTTYLPWMYDNDETKVFTCNDYSIGIGFKASTNTTLLNSFHFVVGSTAKFLDNIEFDGQTLFFGGANFEDNLSVLKNVNIGGNTQVTNIIASNRVNTNDFRTASGTDFKFRKVGGSNLHFYMGIDRGGSGNVAIGSFVTGSGAANLILQSAGGNVGIGTNCIPANTRLAVQGNIAAREITIDAESWCDYVFEKDYKLRTLSELDAYIKQEKHLPEIPTTEEVMANGIALGEMNILLLKKIEELTLYTLQQQKEIEKLKKMVYGK